MFHEQVSAISQWFTEWTEAEQMVLLYSLLKRLSTLQVKFLSRVVDQHLTDCAELQMLEQQANNPAFISSLLTKSKEIAISQLLVLLPLLRPDNVEAKSRYLAIIPTVLSHSVETGDHLTEAKQLISYSLIHPAILSDDRKQLTPWVQILKTRFNLLSGTPVLPLPESSQSWSNQQQRPPKETAGLAQCNLQQVRVRRSNSLTPPVSLCQSTELWTSQDDLCAKQKPRSFSLSSEHCPPLSPQSSQASSGSGSETQLDETKSFNSDFPGMRDVGTWLKALRLHKYIWLFAQLSYDEMLALTEEKLEALGVTKGARHKIILSIKKLKDRYNTLCQLEKDVMRSANLVSVLEELKTILSSPIKPLPVTSDINETENKTEMDDIPNQFTKVLGKVCTHLIVVNGGREEDAVRTATWLLERCISHESFVPHRRKLETWKLQLHSLWLQTHQRQKWHHNQSHFTAPNSSNLTDTRSLRRSSVGFQNRGLYLLPPAPYQPSLSNPQLALNPYSLSQSLVSPTNVLSHNNVALSTEPQTHTVQQSEVQTSLGVERCRQTTISDKQSDSDINSKLEDLCLSMAEHFLEGVS